MTKEEANLLGLAPLTQAGGGGLIVYGAVANVGRPPTKTEQRIELETQKHLLVIRNQRLKAEAAVHELAQVHQQGAQEFLEIASHFATLKETARGKDYQVLVEEFTQRSAQLAAQHLFGIMEVSARNIGMDTARPLYREEEPEVVKVVEKPRGLLRRLIGD
jgi:hypothetical protein